MQAAGMLFALRSGLRWSNYVIGRVELAPDRVATALSHGPFDCALFEYWHATDAARLLRQRGIPCVLDMHDLLWQSRRRQLDAVPALPGWWKGREVERYRAQEEASWSEYDALITINRAEHDYVATRVPDVPLIHAPMGTDLEHWRYGWAPSTPPRVAYYGGLSSIHNQESALACFEHLLPGIRRAHPDTELWIVGSHPPDRVKALARERGVHVTGFVPDAPALLSTMSAVLCPWSGTYGFRSRLIEVMALGVPVVATPDAVYGMDMEEEHGIRIGGSHDDLVRLTSELLSDASLAARQSRLAREQVVRRFGLDATYGALVSGLLGIVDTHEGSGEAARRLA
jgi:glycosyltransferase involved in cell wall biosynthesis